jgi:hypothetical protein
MKTRLALVAAVLVAVTLVAAAPAGAGGPSSTSISISSTATQTTALTIAVGVTVTCATPAFGAGFGSVTVSQPQTGAVGFGNITPTCDGQAHKLAVFVVSIGVPWALGNADASAFACGFACDSTVRQIRITAP